jgi:hypothetical protein
MRMGMSLSRCCRRLGIASLLTAMCGCFVAAPVCVAGLGVVPPGDPSGLGFAAEVSSTQAGAHPDASTSFNITPPLTADVFNGEGSSLKDILVDLPPGIVGNPETVQKCTIPQLLPDAGNITNCPSASQVGVVEIRTQLLPFLANPSTLSVAPVYAVQPRPDQLAVLAIKISGSIVLLEASVRPSDHGVRLTARNATQFPAPLRGTTVWIWGVPADPSSRRGCVRPRMAIRICLATRGCRVEHFSRIRRYVTRRSSRRFGSVRGGSRLSEC